MRYRPNDPGDRRPCRAHGRACDLPHVNISRAPGSGTFHDKLSFAQRIRKSIAQASASACVEKRRELSCNKGPLAKVTRQRPLQALLTSGNPGFMLVCLGSRSKAAR